MLISYKKPKGRFFIVGKPGGSPAVTRHISITVDDPTHGTLLIDGTAVTLDANNTWEDDISDGDAVSIEMQMNSMFGFGGWQGNVPDWQSDYGYCYINPTTIIMNGDYIITTRSYALHTLEVVVDPSKYTLMVYDIQHTSNYTSVNAFGGCDKLQIVPETGYQFNSWGSAWNNNTTNPDYWCYYNDAVITPDVTAVTPTQPNDEIWYTSTDGQVVTPNKAKFGTGITVVSNTYADGKGVIKLSGDTTIFGSDCFKNCTTLASIDIPDSVTKIDTSSFNECRSLTSIVLPNNLTTFGIYVFYNCISLINVELPSSVTNISKYCFYGCSNLTSCVCNPTTPPTLGNSVFTNALKCQIYVPAESVTAYQTANNWSDYSSRIQAIP